MWADKLLMACARKNLAVESKSVRRRPHSVSLSLPCSLSIALSLILPFPSYSFPFSFHTFRLVLRFLLECFEHFYVVLLAQRLTNCRRLWRKVFSRYAFFIVFPVNLPWTFDVCTPRIASFVRLVVCGERFGGYSRGTHLRNHKCHVVLNGN